MAEQPAFVPVGSKPMSAEYGETLWGVHKSTGIPYKHPENVVDASCLLCEQRVGRPLEVCNNGIHITMPMCAWCRDEIMQYDELPDELNDIFFERLVERREIDRQVEMPSRDAAKVDPPA